MPDGAETDLFQRARRVGVWCWCERRLFESLGRWSTTTTTAAADAGVLFGEMSRRHGWHAELFFDRLPELASVDPESMVASPGPATVALFDHLDPEEPTAVTRLTAAYRVLLPLMLKEYREALRSVSPVGEPSLGRWLEIVVRDDLEEWSRGEALLRHLADDESSVRASSAHQMALELRVLATGSLTR